jgi:choline kinase
MAYGPACLGVVEGRRILDLHLEDLTAAGLTRVVYAGGYGIESVRAQYPELTFCRNAEWQATGSLATLMNAEFHMDDGFLCADSDVIYSPQVVSRLVDCPQDVALLCDTSSAGSRPDRDGEPLSDEETLSVVNGQVVQIGRPVGPESARGTYAGLARFTREGARFLRDAYHRARAKYGGRPFRGASTFAKAHIVDLYQEMIEEGMPMHLVEVDGGTLRVGAEEGLPKTGRFSDTQGFSRSRR